VPGLAGYRQVRLHGFSALAHWHGFEECIGIPQSLFPALQALQQVGFLMVRWFQRVRFRKLTRKIQQSVIGAWITASDGMACGTVCIR